MKKREIFLLESAKNHILFIPKIGLIVKLLDSEWKKMSKIKKQRELTILDIENIIPSIDKKILEKRVFVKPQESNIDSITLFPTFNCPLRCSYCYSNGGLRKENMNLSTAKKAIEFVLKTKNKGEEFNLEFHGGGEPSQNWYLLEKITNYFRNACKKKGVKSNISISTNGIFNKEKAKWMIKNIDSIQLSFDGPDNIQNTQRPTVNGKKSFDYVFENANFFYKNKKDFTIHFVVTQHSINKMISTGKFFLSNFPGIALHVEPVSILGRSLENKMEFPNPTVFVKNFLRLEKISKKYFSSIIYSGVNKDLKEISKRFCGISIPNFIVTPKGLITSCHMIDKEDSLLSNFFIYGKVGKKIELNENIMKTLKKWNVDKHPTCKTCFAKYHCSGDCLAKNLQIKNGHVLPINNPRCIINKELLNHYIFNLFSGENDENIKI